MTDSPQRDGDAPGDPLSAHLAEAYSRLRDDAHRVDLGAARRDLDKRIGAAGDGARSSTWRWVPVTFAALLLVVAVVSAVAIVNRVPSGDQRDSYTVQAWSSVPSSVSQPFSLEPAART